MRVAALILASMALAGCLRPDAQIATRAAAPELALPAMKSFSGSVRTTGVNRSNKDIAQDILDLTFELESGRMLPVFTRFEGPVRIGIATRVPKAFETDLAALIGRLRAEAGIDIERVSDPARANILITTLPRAELQKAVPSAACFVVPRVTGWADFRANRSNGQLDWATLTRRESAAVFIPSDVPPQEARDCLHEEIAQALGPVNDIYRLGDSTFNDDNFQTVLTGFDMLVLRTVYDPALKSGMSRSDVAERLPAILARANPQGEAIRPKERRDTTRNWTAAIDTALGPRTPGSKRLAAAHRAVNIARAQGWTDNRLGFSLFALGRLALGFETATSIQSFTTARDLYARLYGADDIHAAHIAMQMGAYALSIGESAEAIDIVNRAIPAALAAENAALLSSLLMIKAEALDAQGDRDGARAVRHDSLGWAQYGFGDGAAIRARMSDIAALVPRKDPGA